MKHKYKEQILKLKDEGKTFTEIMKITGAASSTVSYHCGKGQKEKYRKRNLKNRKKLHPYYNRIISFNLNRPNKQLSAKSICTNLRLIQQKIHTFHKDRKTKEYQEIQFTVQDVINKLGENPKCYLTGQSIDIYKPRTYQFDHIVPVSKGGDNSLENLGICTRDANLAKGGMMLEDFYKLCEDVIRVRDNKNVKIGPN